MNIFAASLQLYCKKHKISVRQLEADIKVSRPTINRFLQGRTIDSDNFTKIQSWALLTEAKHLDSAPQKNSTTPTSTSPSEVAN